MKIIPALIAGLLACLPAGSAAAQTLILPAGLYEVADEGFSGCSAVSEAVVPEGTVRLGGRAFADCSELNRVYVPGSVVEIGEGCFDGCGEALLIDCAPGSTAHDYALAEGLDYDADTACRALIVGQSYAGTSLALEGPNNDARAVRFMLMNQTDRPFATVQKSNLTAEEILAAAGSAFSAATERDISLFYYSGHGSSRGELIGSDEETVSPSELRSALDQVPGRKILIIDACYSGYFIGAASADAQAQNFSDAFMEGFLGKARSAAGEYFIITSAHKYEQAMEMPIMSGSLTKVMGVFTFFFCRGCGWDGVTSRSTDMYADQNGDGAASIAEAFAYAAEEALFMGGSQHAQTNSEDCRAFAPFR